MDGADEAAVVVGVVHGVAGPVLDHGASAREVVLEVEGADAEDAFPPAGWNPAGGSRGTAREERPLPRGSAALADQGRLPCSDKWPFARVRRTNLPQDSQPAGGGAVAAGAVGLMAVAPGRLAARGREQVAVGVVGELAEQAARAADLHEAVEGVVGVVDGVAVGVGDEVAVGVVGVVLDVADGVGLGAEAVEGVVGEVGGVGLGVEDAAGVADGVVGVGGDGVCVQRVGSDVREAIEGVVGTVRDLAAGCDDGGLLPILIIVEGRGFAKGVSVLRITLYVYTGPRCLRLGLALTEHPSELS